MKIELHHVDILTDDMQKSIDFYQNKLGMQLVFHSDAGGTDVALVRTSLFLPIEQAQNSSSSSLVPHL
jgi:catechol 2,3-dioxygenase-like lactoylglutathione lyase family enzyme